MDRSEEEEQTDGSMKDSHHHHTGTMKSNEQYAHSVATTIVVQEFKSSDCVVWLLTMVA